MESQELFIGGKEDSMVPNLIVSLLDEQKCFEVLHTIRWPDGIQCPKCGSRSLWYDYAENPKMQYKCTSCKHWWTDFTGTFFEGTHQPLSIWFLIIQWFIEEKSSLWVSKELGINRHTVEHMYKRLREDLWARRFMERLSGTTECDEVYISCGEKRSKQTKRNPRKRGLKKKGRSTWDGDKPPVIGVVERESGEVRKNAQKVTCNEVIEKHVEVGSIVNTDEWGGYNDLLDKGYEHKTVCHSKGEYARDDDGDGVCEVHVNTMEGTWSLLRQYLRTFRGVCKKYLYLYVNTFEFLHNLKRRAIEGTLQFLLKILLLPHKI